MNKINRFFSLFSIVMCLFAISCSNLLNDGKSDRGEIKIQLPSIRGTGNSARAADETDETTKTAGEAEFTLELTSSKKETIKKTGKSGESIVFEDIEPGIYSLSCSVGIGKDLYADSKENINVEEGVTTTVQLVLKKVVVEPDTPEEPTEPEEPKEPLEPEEPIEPEEPEEPEEPLEPEEPEVPYEPGYFFLDESINEYKFYFRAEDVPVLKKNTIIKFTYSGVPDVSLTGGLELNYYGWDDELKEYCPGQNTLVTMKKDLIAGEPVEDSAYFVVIDDVTQGFTPSFDLFYHPEQLDSELKLADFTCSFEEVDSVTNDRVVISEDEKGIRFDIKRRATDLLWADVGMIEREYGISMIALAGEESDAMTFYWPFAKAGKLYRFTLYGLIGDEYLFTEVAYVAKNDTPLQLNDELYEKYVKSEIIIDDTADEKRFRMETELLPGELSNIIPGVENNFFYATVVADETNHIDFFMLDNDSIINDFMTDGVDFIYSGLIHDPVYFYGTMKDYTEYKLETGVTLVNPNYEGMCFVLPNILARTAAYNAPSEPLMKRNDDNNCCMHIDLNQELNYGDFVMLTLSGSLDYKIDSPETLEPTNIFVGVQDKAADNWYEYTTAYWNDIGTGIPANTQFKIQGGLYINQHTEHGQIQLCFNNESPLEENLFLQLKDFEYDFQVYPAGINDSGQLNSTIKFIDYTTVTKEYQAPLRVNLSVPKDVISYSSFEEQILKFRMTGDCNIAPYNGSMSVLKEQNNSIKPIIDYKFSFNNGTESIEGSGFQIQEVLTGSSGATEIIFDTPVYDLRINDYIFENETVIIQVLFDPYATSGSTAGGTGGTGSVGTGGTGSVGTGGTGSTSTGSSAGLVNPNGKITNFVYTVTKE